MIRSLLVAASAAALAVGLVPGASAAPPGSGSDPAAARATTTDGGALLRLAEGGAPALYIVRLESPPVASYDGGIQGLAPTKVDGGQQLDADAAPVMAYEEYLLTQQAEVVSAAAAEIDRAPALEYQYTHALNGFATELSTDEARAIAQLPGVASVTPDELRQLQTDVGPEWIGAPTIWGQETGQPAELEGSVYQARERERVLGSFTTGQAIGPQQSHNLDFDELGGGFSGVPDGATAVVLNVTVAGATQDTFVSVCPGGTPTSDCDDESNLNPAAGEDTPAQVIVQLGEGDAANSVEIYNNQGTVEAFVDLAGWFVDGAVSADGAVLQPIAPTRVVNFEPVGAGEMITLDLDDSIDVPDAAEAVALNLTGARVSGTTYVSACEGGTSIEECRSTSVLNLYQDRDAANLTVLDLSEDNTVSFYSNGADIQLVGDAQGWFVDSVQGGSTFQPTEPVRVMDRAPVGRDDMTTLFLDEALGDAGVPAGTTAVALNVTATEGTQATYISVCPGGTTAEQCNDSSVMNPRQGEDRANMVIARLNTDENTVSFYNFRGDVQIIADLAGFFTEAPGGEIRTDGTKGEGIVSGIIDSGIVPENPSFADSVSIADGGDGYNHSNPFGEDNYVGVCNPANANYLSDFPCNDKLIGAWDFTGDQADGGESPRDSDGHGTHTGSTTAGNQVRVTTESNEEPPFVATEVIKGVAPHSNVIAYDVCGIPTPSGLNPGCSLAAIVGAINQAILDEVDVINYSIGGGSSDPWQDNDSLSFLNARAAGIFVATSAGNSGPGAATVGSPAEAPWLTSVGATTHDRQWQSDVTDLTSDGESFPDIDGLGFNSGTDGALPLVDAGDAPYDSPLCLAEELAGTDFSGQIVVCERGTTGRVQKGQVVEALGAAGMILANDEPSGDSLNADPHALPTSHISYDDGQALQAWMASVTGEEGSITGGTRVQSDELGDIMAGFSSRGPNKVSNTMVPSLSAPGVDVLAANGTGDNVQWGFISGTSMASPHVAGAGALMSSLRPSWSPAEIESALMSTAFTDVTDTDGTSADWFDMGSGRVDLTVAGDAGLVLDETTTDYLAADPSAGGDSSSLNLASMAQNACVATCTWERVVKATDTGVGTWSAEGVAVSEGLDVSVEPSSFSFDRPNQTQVITVTADVTGAALDEYSFGQVVLTPGEGSAAPVAHLPVSAYSSNADLAPEMTITATADSGSQESEPIRSAFAVTDLQTAVTGLTLGEETAVGIPQDPTNDDPFNGDGGTQTTFYEVPAEATRFVTGLTDTTAPDFDLFVGTGPTPSAATTVCVSAAGGSAEECDFVPDPADAGQYWVLVQNWQASGAGDDTATLTTGITVADEGNMTVEGPNPGPEPIEAGQPFTVTVNWDEPAMEPGQSWYGTVTLGTDAGNAENIGTFFVTVNRVGTDLVVTP